MNHRDGPHETRSVNVRSRLVSLAILVHWGDYTREELTSDDGKPFIERRRGDTTAAEALARKFTDRFWGTDWPGSSRPSVYYDPRSLELDGPGGVLHAKAVVVDDETVFLTSANMTEAALDRDIEIGLLLRDRALAASVSSHFRGLIERSLLHPLPMS